LALHRSTKRRQSGAPEQTTLSQRIHTLSEQYPRFGYRKICYLLKGEHWGVNRETVHCIRKREGLQVIKQERPRRPVGASTTTPTRAAHPNHVWSYDFVHDETTDGRRLKCLTVLDEYTREGVTISCAQSITANEVVEVLQRLFVQRGAPVYVKSDNGPEFIAQRVTTWLLAYHVNTHIAPGSPWQNGHNESFNGVFRDGCLNHWLVYLGPRGPSHHYQLARGVQSRTTPWRSEGADTTGICGVMLPPIAGKGDMRLPNIETGRVILGLTTSRPQFG
jgi:transposase InsO family protein